MSRDQPRHLYQVLDRLGNPNKTGKNNIWVAKDYSLKDLILDLHHLATTHQPPISHEESAKRMKEFGERLRDDPEELARFLSTVSPPKEPT